MTPKSSNSDDDKMPSDGKSGVGYIDERNALLKDIPYARVRQAWFTLSHMLLDTKTRVAHMGCDDGQFTYALAALNPAVTFIGVNKSRKSVSEASQKYKLDNLEFKVGDISSALFDENSLDGIINSFTLHQVYSNARYNHRIISDTLRKQFSMLKNDGVMFIQDYTKPAGSDFVLLEMHARDSTGEELSKLSEADLLVWYGLHAQPKQDPGCGGFFLEELPPRFPRTRLFRLPYKWAYEFIMRKDNRAIWEEQLPFEFTYFTVADFKRELRSLGAQLLYSAPHWDDEYINKNFDGHFRLMQLNGETLGDPATSFVSVSRKRPESSSLKIEERRLTQEDVGSLQIKTLRNEVNGKILDVVTRSKEIAEIIPYRVDNKGRLYVYLHDGIVRGISNIVHRDGDNIDGREWSGHMLEALSLDNVLVQEMGERTAQKTKDFIKSYSGLTPRDDAPLTAHGIYYPDPNYIDERAHTYYVEIKETDKRLEPNAKLLKDYRFLEKGHLRELSAQNVLDAIAVGLVPNSRLELQILSLMQHAKVKAENWIRKDIHIATSRIIQEFNVKDFFRLLNKTDLRYKEVKGSAGQLKTVSSIFVEEGQSQGGRAGIVAEPLDFVLHNDKTINTVVILPLSKNLKGDINAGFIIEHMPVPQRFEGNGLSLNAPQYNIPKEIKNYRQLKQFVAEKMGVKTSMVMKLGESYYTHIGITPQRIHPFAVFAPPSGFKGINFMPINRYMKHWSSLSKSTHFMTIIARAYRFLPDHMKLQAKRDVKAILKKAQKALEPQWSLPLSVPQGPEGQGGISQNQGQFDAGGIQDDMALSQDTPPPQKKDQEDDPSQEQDKDKDGDGDQGAQGTNKIAKKSFLELKNKKKKSKKKKKKMGIEGKTVQTDASIDSDDFEDEENEKKKRNMMNYVPDNAPDNDTPNNDSPDNDEPDNDEPDDGLDKPTLE